MRHTSERHTDAADRAVKDIRRKTRKVQRKGLEKFTRARILPHSLPENQIGVDLDLVF